MKGLINGPHISYKSLTLFSWGTGAAIIRVRLLLKKGMLVAQKVIGMKVCYEFCIF